MNIPEKLNEELNQVLRADSGRLGEVFILDELRTPVEEIRQILQVSSTSTIGHARRSVEAIRDGRNLPGIGPAQRAHMDLKRILREQHSVMSPELRAFLEERLEQLRVNIQELEDQSPTIIEDLPDPTTEVDRKSISGVYVWSLSTYLRDQDDRQNVWLRIGQSDDVMQRFAQHRRDMKLPEPLRLLRIYSHPSRTPSELETDFHSICSAARHDRAAVYRKRDREWFRTSLEFLDEFATQKGCLFYDELTDADFRRD